MFTYYIQRLGEISMTCECGCPENIGPNSTWGEIIKYVNERYQTNEVTDVYIKKLTDGGAEAEFSLLFKDNQFIKYDFSKMSILKEFVRQWPAVQDSNLHINNDTVFPLTTVNEDNEYLSSSFNIPNP